MNRFKLWQILPQTFTEVPAAICNITSTSKQIQEHANLMAVNSLEKEVNI